MFSNCPNAIQIVLQISGYTLLFFSVIKTQEIAESGLDYFKRVNPAIEQIVSGAKGPNPSQVTITPHQFLALAGDEKDQPMKDFHFSTLNLAFVFGLFLILNTSPNDRRLPDRPTSPND